jgi:hypothetical protein
VFYKVSRRKWAVVAVVALGVSGSALADDSSMNPFTGDSYKFFNDRAANSSTVSVAAVRPRSMSERELQALSSAGLSSAWQIEAPTFAVAAAEPTWRQTHPHGLTEAQLQAMAASGLPNAWKVADEADGTSSSSIAEADGSQAGGKVSFIERLARIFRADPTTTR